MDPVGRTEVPRLIPGAPEPESAHLRLALLWAQGELAQRRVQVGQLSPEQVTAVRTAVAARALAYRAGLGSGATLEQAAAGGAARVLESIEIDGELTAKFRAPQRADQAQVEAAGQWERLADSFLALALPARPSAWGFPGAAR